MNDLSVVKSFDSMTSLEIAKLTGKRHADVCKDLRRLDEDAVIALGSFAQTEKDVQNKDRVVYHLPKRETLILTSGYSSQQRAAIIDRWLELEASQAPQTFLEALKLAVKLEEEKERLVEQQKYLEQKIEDDYPKVQFAEYIVASDESLLVGEYAKAMSEAYGVKIGPNKLMEAFRDHGYLMIGRSPRERNQPYQKWVAKDWFEYDYL